MAATILIKITTTIQQTQLKTKTKLDKIPNLHTTTFLACTATIDQESTCHYQASIPSAS